MKYQNTTCNFFFHNKIDKIVNFFFGSYLGCFDENCTALNIGQLLALRRHSTRLRPTSPIPDMHVVSVYPWQSTRSRHKSQRSMDVRNQKRLDAWELLTALTDYKRFVHCLGTVLSVKKQVHNTVSNMFRFVFAAHLFELLIHLWILVDFLSIFCTQFFFFFFFSIHNY